MSYDPNSKHSDSSPRRTADSNTTPSDGAHSPEFDSLSVSEHTLESLGVSAMSNTVAAAFLKALKLNPDIASLCNTVRERGYTIVLSEDLASANKKVSISTEHGTEFRVTVGSRFDFGLRLEEFAASLFTDACVQMAMHTEGVQTLNATEQVSVDRPEGQIRSWHFQKIHHNLQLCERLNYLLDNAYYSSVPTVFNNTIGAAPAFPDKASQDAAWTHYWMSHASLQWTQQLQYAAVSALICTLVQHPASNGSGMPAIIEAAFTGVENQYNYIPSSIRQTLRMLSEELYHRNDVLDKTWHDPEVFLERAMLLIDASEIPRTAGTNFDPPDSIESFISLRDRYSVPRKAPVQMRVQLSNARA